MRVAIVHDYLTQRGGAERVVLAMLKAFPEARVHTSLYSPRHTFPEFRDADIRPLWLNRIASARRWHRSALPLLAPAFSSLSIDADVVLCSSSGWAHGVRTEGRKVVYCHSPAKWLYRGEDYNGASALRRAAAGVLARPLVAWDKTAAATADTYLVNSTAIQAMVQSVYGRESAVLPPPPTLDPYGERERVPGIAPGFHLCVSRLLPYKNVRAVVDAFAGLPSERLVVVGVGPEERRLRTLAAPNVTFAGAVSDNQLRWLYGSASAHVTASREDFGLTTIEAAAFGKPSVTLRWGGFLDTVVDGVTGTFFDHAEPQAIRDAIHRLRCAEMCPDGIREHADTFSLETFVRRLRDVVAPAPRLVPDLVGAAA
jgi:glycosyltransferase involved in cell wall biosynthesis